jgi:hypothetical protein
MFLFRVENTFRTSLGLLLMPEQRPAKISIGSKVKLVRPDKAVLDAVITGIVFETGDISVGKDLTQQDVPIGTEVWLIE